MPATANPVKSDGENEIYAGSLGRSTEQEYDVGRSRGEGFGTKIVILRRLLDGFDAGSQTGNYAAPETLLFDLARRAESRDHSLSTVE